MGVASIEAAQRFDVGAAALSTLAVAQLAVYAAMQIPVGMLLDRFGARKLIIFGSVATGVGNLIVAASTALVFAVIGRMLVGFGDAFIFISMIRLVNGWVLGAKATRYTQLFANIGQLGQIASAVPFAYLLGIAGWAPAFTVAAGLALAAAALGLLALRDEPGETESKIRRIGAWQQFRENLSDPYTRKAFWVHFTLQSSGSVFILLWGYPFLVIGEGLSRPIAAMLMGSFVFIGFAVGPALSYLCATYPKSRHRLVSGVYALIVLAWSTVLVTPGENPMWQIILIVLSLGVGGPASMIAFDYSRTSIPKQRLGSANGIINSGGFIATFSSMLFVGFALDSIRELGWSNSKDLYALSAFKMAFPIQLIILTFGLIMFYRERRLTHTAKE
jgi:MFS family permease